MARPRTINPKGDTVRLVTLVPAPVAARIRKQAQRQGVTVAQVLRDLLQQVA